MVNPRVLAACCSAILLAATGTASAQDANSTFKVFWKDGIRAESGDGNFKWKLGGRLQYDGAFFDQDEANVLSFPASSPCANPAGCSMHDGTEFRRARLELDAVIYERFIFKTQYDFAGGSPALKDAYLGMTGVPYLGRIRIGQSIEPLSLDQITSSKYSEFMERGLTTTFAPDRNPGINMNNSFFDDRMTYGFGVFRNGDDTSGNSGGDGTWAVTGRLTGLPWYADEAKLLHIGVAARYTDVAGKLAFSSRPESRQAVRMADTGSFKAAQYFTVGPEMAFLYGPFSVQGEFMYANTDAPAVEDPNFYAYTFAASYWLTGETRRFKPDLAEFDRVKPNRNLLQSGGFGAWEIALRYSFLDLNDGLIQGGELADVTVGLNWQWNPNMRMMFNYIYANADDYKTGGSNGTANIFQARAQVDF